MKNIYVGILMGSDSDLSVMSEAVKILDELGIKYELTIASAHRTPERTLEYSKKAQGRGLKVIIAGAGGSAHFAGVIAALTILPVIGVPISTKIFDGLDSLLSMVQMPSGVPVATVAVNGAKNAGILAAQILAISDNSLVKKLEKYKSDLKNKVEEKALKLEKIGFKKYLKSG